MCAQFNTKYDQLEICNNDQIGLRKIVYVYYVIITYNSVYTVTLQRYKCMTSLHSI